MSNIHPIQVFASLGIEVSVDGSEPITTKAELEKRVRFATDKKLTITAYKKQLAALESGAALQAIKKECGKRIAAVVKDANTQRNVAMAMQLDMLTDAEKSTVVAGYGWIRSMQAKCADIASNNLNPNDDASWPDAPAGVRDLADKF